MSYFHIYRFEGFMFASRHIPYTYWAHPSRPILERCSADSRPEPPAAAWTGEQDLGREVLTFASWACPSKCPCRSEPLWWLHKSSRCKCSIPQQLLSSRVMEQQQTQTVACRGLESQNSGQLLWIDVSLPVLMKIFEWPNPCSQELQLISLPWG